MIYSALQLAILIAFTPAATRAETLTTEPNRPWLMATEIRSANRITVNKGDKFGKLAILKQVENRDGKRWFLCRCDCGQEKEISFFNLRRRKNPTICCGCSHRSGFESHGLSQTREYKIWSCMKERCGNPHHIHYGNYGGSGITVCQEWMHSFQTFLADMGRCPSPIHSIDRIDGSGAYCKENCRWATRAEQARNMKTNVVTLQVAKEIQRRYSAGERVCVLANEFGLKWDTAAIIAKRKVWGNL